MWKKWRCRPLHEEAAAPCSSSTNVPGQAGSRWRDQELGLTVDAPSRGEHPPGSTKCHPPVQSTNLRFPGRVKGYSGACEGGKSNTVLGYLRNPCFLPVQAYLRFPFPRDQAFNLYSSQFLHALITILSAQLG